MTSRPAELPRMSSDSQPDGGAPARGAMAVLAVAEAMPPAALLESELACAAEAAARGYFLPDEEALVRVRYSQYLGLRVILLETLEELGGELGRGAVEWRGRLPVFATAFAAACILMRATRFVVSLAADKPVVWKKLDEPDEAAGIPRKTFTGVYRSAARASNWRRFLAAADFYFENKERIAGLASDPELAPLVALLVSEEPWIERRRRDALRRLFSYRWFSFLRRHRSAWRQVMFGLFEASGRAIAELRQPGVKPADAPKRVTEVLRAEVVARAKPGDVFVTRHDDAVSNWFLPGFWPHAALCLGSSADIGLLGLNPPDGSPPDALWFLEAKKDGVRLRSVGETLMVDAFAMLRPPLGEEEMRVALARAAAHLGKPYDFLFDFRTSDRLACTEVIYRGFHGVGPIRFHLEEVGGRLCLPAEELLNQALDCGFRVVAAGGFKGDKLLSGTSAEVAFHGARQPI